MIEEFINFCVNGRNFTDASVKQYSVVVGQWAHYCEIIGKTLETATSEDVMNWILFQSSSSIKAVTINNRITICRSMYDFACRFLGHDVNPFVGIQNLKVPKLLPAFIPPSVIKQAVETHRGTTFLQVRARAVVMFLFTSGLRRSELIALKLHDVDDKNKVIHVFGKGRKERLVPLADAVLPFLSEWLVIRSYTLTRPSDAFFCSSDGLPMSPDGVRKIVAHMFLGLVPKKLAHPHALRHSYATYLMQKGMPIPDISRLLGHNSMATTLKYLSLSAPNQYASFINSVF